LQQLKEGIRKHAEIAIKISNSRNLRKAAREELALGIKGFSPVDIEDVYFVHDILTNVFKFAHLTDAQKPFLVGVSNYFKLSFPCLYFSKQVSEALELNSTLLFILTRHIFEKNRDSIVQTLEDSASWEPTVT
jgi:hypothetical protein